MLGIPYDASSSHLRGAADAPALIRKALHSDSSNLWTENGTDLGAADLLADAGDLAFKSDQSVLDEIEQGVSSILKAGLSPLCLGGDHSVTFPIIKAMSTRYPDLTILHFDAHPDLYDEFNGDRYSHACPFARIMEADLATRLVQIGIRTMNGHQREQADRFGVEVIEMKDWNDEFLVTPDRPVYISFDMDCLDPAFAPGISHWEPGGFSTRQVLHVIQSLHAPLIGADIVEYNPRVETPITGMVAAKVLKEIAAKMLEAHDKHGH
ncbi:MAG: agmatinase [Anaerolineae bacterium]|nr:agmatinase [Anaerolineae bacterium]